MYIFNTFCTRPFEKKQRCLVSISTREDDQSPFVLLVSTINELSIDQLLISRYVGFNNRVSGYDPRVLRKNKSWTIF